MKSANLQKAPRRETQSIRIPAADCRLIDRAASLSGKTRTEFVLTAARTAATEALLDRAPPLVGPAQFQKFLALLDAPPKPNARLRRTMTAAPPWLED